jgi:hypothetical protein
MQAHRKPAALDVEKALEEGRVSVVLQALHTSPIEVDEQVLSTFGFEPGPTATIAPGPVGDEEAFTVADVRSTLKWTQGRGGQGAGPSGIRPHTLYAALSSSSAAQMGMARWATQAAVGNLPPRIAGRRPHAFANKTTGKKRLISVSDAAWSMVERMALQRVPDANEKDAAAEGVRRAVQARAGVPMVAVDIAAAFASAPTQNLIEAAGRTWPTSAVNVLRTSLAGPLIYDGKTYVRPRGGHEGSSLMPAAFAAYYRSIAGPTASIYADDAIIAADEFAAFEARVSDAGLDISYAKSCTFNCDPRVAPRITARDTPTATMLGVPVRAETRTKAEIALEDVIARGAGSHHAAMTMVVAAADACSFTIRTALRPAVDRIMKLLELAASKLQAPLPARLQPDAIGRLRAAAMVALLVNNPDLVQHAHDPWVVEAMAHATRLGFSFTGGLRRRGTAIEPRSVSQSTLLRETQVVPDAARDLVQLCMHTVGPRPRMSDGAFAWAAGRDSDAMVARLRHHNNDQAACGLCGQTIGPDHPITCTHLDSLLVVRSYTHDKIMERVAQAVTRVGLPCAKDCTARRGGAFGSTRPDLRIEDVWVEIKTVADGSHPRPLDELRRVVRHARTHYVERGHADAWVIGVTTRGVLSSDCREDLAALAKKISAEEWRPGPAVDTVVAAAIAEANSERWTTWSERVTAARG